MSKRHWAAALTAAAAALVGATSACDSSAARGQTGHAQDRQASPQGHGSQHAGAEGKHEAGDGMATTFAEVGREERTFAVSGVPQVRIDNFEGSVTVKSWDRAEVGFTAVKRGVDKAALDGIQLQASQRGDEVVLGARFTKGDRRMRLGGSDVRAKGAYVEWEVSVPRAANVSLATGDGPLSVTGVDGLVELRTGDGKIEVFDGRGRVNARTNDGLIRIARFDGEVEAREMGDHGINLEGRFARVTAETGGSAIWLALPAGADATLETD
ncbi:MAG TPA: hypothetical protein VF611_13120, partial [Pyrinomonadaceae bacterium]